MTDFDPDLDAGLLFIF